MIKQKALALRWKIEALPLSELKTGISLMASELYSEIEGATNELFALRELREACGSYCERLPVEVREALHAVPEIEKTHQCKDLG